MYESAVKGLEYVVLHCELSNATQLLTISVLNNEPQFAFAIVYKPLNTNEDIFHASNEFTSSQSTQN